MPERHADADQIGLAPVRGSTRVCTVVAVTHDHRGHRQEGDAGLQRREAEVLLHVVGEEQEYGEDARAGEGDRRVGAAAGRSQTMCSGSSGCAARRSMSTNASSSTALGGERRRSSAASDHESVSALEKP